MWLRVAILIEIFDIEHGDIQSSKTRQKPYNSERHNKRPKGSHGIRANGLKHRHIMLRVLCFDGIRLIIGNFRIFVELMVRLLVNVVPASILYLHLLLSV